jgi:translation initiation factor 2 alpha subunit (eIF-2alpha)
MAELEQGDVVLCTVDRIAGTTVFVNIEGVGEGRIILSEIAPGRIRNLRDYVVPKKTIVCKILRISGENIDLSLRRVNQKEKKEVMERYNLERSFKSVFKSILKEKTTEILDKISRESNLYDFVEELKKDQSELEKLIGKENTKRILDIILNSQKAKKTILKKELQFQSTAPNGLELIKENLGKIKELEIKYLSAGRYSLKIEAEDLKKADNKIKEIYEEIEKKKLQETELKLL